MAERSPTGALKDCPKCKGRGFIPAVSLLQGGVSCPCIDTYLRERNLDTVWMSLGQTVIGKETKAIPASLKDKSCRITTTRPVFQSYLKKFVLEQPHAWSCKVRTDAELLDAWFGTAKAQGVKIFDLDIEGSDIPAIDIRDLVVPFDLCIIWLGVKTLPNKEAPGALLEAINYRAHVGKPTWVVDQPTKVLDASHLYFSMEAAEMFSTWPHLVLSKNKVDLKKKTALVEAPPKQETTTAITNKMLEELVQNADRRKTKR